jgi:hypothetical protein
MKRYKSFAAGLLIYAIIAAMALTVLSVRGA